LSVHLIVCFYGSAIDPGPLQQLKMAFRGNNNDNDATTSTRFHAICLKPSDPPRSPNNPLSQKVQQKKNEFRDMLCFCYYALSRFVKNQQTKLYC
jgi:hypothetical protein